MKNDQVKREISNYWNQFGETYDSYLRHGIQSKKEDIAWKHALKDLLPADTVSILDVGAGTGFLTLQLAELGYHVKSTDISEGMLNVAMRKAKEKHLTPQIEFSICDAEELKETDESYDVVISRHLLWTLPHPDQAVKEWIRVTKKGGRVIIIDADWYFDDTSISETTKQDSFKSEEENSTSYKKEINDMLPLVTGAQNAKTLLDSFGYHFLQYDLINIDQIERQSFSDNADQAINFKKRFVYIIEK